MKGYFGQLARRTGLNIGNQASAAGRSSTEAAVPKASVPVAPIHVEEVVFTASSPAVVSDVSAGKASSAISDVTNQAARVAAPSEAFASPRENISVDANQNASVGQTETAHHTAGIPDTRLSHETPLHESRVRFVAPEPQTAKPVTEQVFFDERPLDQSTRTVSAESQPLTEETQITVSATEDLQQPDYETRDSSVRHHEVHSVEIINQVEKRPPTPANANVAEAAEREPRRIFQDQLKEVIAWITSPPEEVEQTTFEMVEAEHDTSTVVIREREQRGLAERPSKASEPHINDLSLSIGTISIVVEEPKQDFPVSIAPAPTTHTSPQPVAPEPTRLSRYYLRNL